MKTVLTTAHSAPKRRRLIPLFIGIVGVGMAVWYGFGRSPSKYLTLSGRIEGYETDIGTKVAGRIVAVTVREGDPVTPDQVLVQISDDTVQAQLQGATARVVASQAQLRQAQLQLGVIDTQILAAQLTLTQAQQEATGRISQGTAAVAVAQSQLAQALAQSQQAQADLKLTIANRDRYRQLRQEGAISQQQGDQAEAAASAAQATLTAREAAIMTAQQQVNGAEGSLLQSQTSRFNPAIRQSQIEALQRQRQQAQQIIQSATADVAQAQANQRQVQASLADLTIRSPLAGVVTIRSVEPGAVVTAGKTLLTLLDPTTVYMRGFIPEGQIGAVTIGQPARVFLDAAPRTPIMGRVAAIDAQASFTPENIYFQQDRVKQVFGVKIALDQLQGLAKPGMPADAELLPLPVSQP